jgi:antitoxin (DNA-binding transcriptional repressor) of toxin-antitoxin stability system
MKSVNVAELKYRLSAYLKLARNGEEIIIRDRKLPIAKLIPVSSHRAVIALLQDREEGL